MLFANWDNNVSQIRINCFSVMPFILISERYLFQFMNVSAYKANPSP